MTRRVRTGRCTDLSDNRVTHYASASPKPMQTIVFMRLCHIKARGTVVASTAADEGPTLGRNMGYLSANSSSQT